MLGCIWTYEASLLYFINAIIRLLNSRYERIYSILRYNQVGYNEVFFGPHVSL